MRGDEKGKVSGSHAATPALLAHELRVPAQPAVAPELERHYYFL